jgi:hypothetical protein
MTLKHPARLASFAALALTFFLAACSTPEAPPPPPPPPAAPPAVNLASQLFEEASAWRGYMARAEAITPEAFTDAKAVSRSLKTGAAFEPNQLLRGAIAYAAVTALQDPTFVGSVRSYAGDVAQRQALANQILANPYRVTNFPGAESAAGLIVSALGGEATKVLLTGRAVKQSAYDVQRQKWSKEFVSDREGRLADVRVLSATPVRGDIQEVSRMQLATQSGGPPPGDSVVGQAAQQPWSPVVVRGMALAALAVLGEAGDDRMPQLAPLLTDQPSMFCLNMSKLMLYQCLAAAKPHYEDMFCLGQHVLIDTGECTLKSAGAPMPMLPPPVIVAEETTAKAPVKGKPAVKGKPKAQ